MEEPEKLDLKGLRGTRKEAVAAATARAKRQKKDIAAIKAKMGERSMTVPEISQETGIEAADVLWYIAALKKYGVVVEVEKDGSYFRYGLAGASGEPQD